MPDRVLVIVADVDGTLLDMGGRLPVPVSELRERLDRTASALGASVRLALASSRTLDELLVLQRALGIVGPCVAEDGGTLAIDAEDATGALDGRVPDERRAGRRTLRVWRFGDEARTLRDAWGSDWEVTVAPYELDTRDRAAMHALGFRTPGMIRRAISSRNTSVLLRLDGADDAQRSAIVQRAGALGATVHRGGRWFTLTRGAGKGQAVAQLRALLAPACEHSDCLFVGIGNEENDATLLAATDLAFAINNPGQGAHPALAAVPDVIALEAEGASGFVEMLDRLAEMRPFEDHSS